MRFRGNLRLALRSLFKRPGFSIPVVLTLALGIGANTAIFSIVYTLLLKPLPFPDAERVVRVYDTQLEFKTAPAAHREYVDWRDQNRVFEEIGGAWPFRPTLTGVGEPEQLIGARVTASFLRVFSAPPLAGRWFLDDEDRPGGPSVAILSEHLWIGRFGRAPEVIGRVVRLDGVPRTVVGVMAEGAARMISGLLHGVAPSDPWVLGGTCAAALLAALAAAYLPARSASTVDPSVTLRSL